MIADFFAYGFLTRALIAGVLLAIIAPMLGIFLTVRRYSLIADTLSHASLAGVALGIVFGVNPMATAILVALASALGIERLRMTGRFSGESVLALFLSGSLAFAVVALSTVNALNGGVLAYLFGSITTVSVHDVWMIGGLTVIILGIVWWRYADFFLLSFDEEIAKASGRPVMRDSMLLAMMTAATVAVSLRVVGVLLIGALMVIPVLAAMAWGKGFRTTMGIAIALSVFSVMTGLAVSYRFDTATGGTIVLCSLVLFVMSVVLRRVTIQ